jgi:hypothetical protein
MRISKLSVGAAVVLAAVSFAGSALAQAEASGEVGMTLPGAVGGAKAQGTPGESDHDAMIGRLAVGYMGRFQIPLASGGALGGLAGAPGVGTVTAPAVGIRYWLDQGMGIDVGIGLLSTGGSASFNDGNTTVTADEAGVNAGILHAGLPLALASSKHFTFLLAPELNVGFAQQTEEGGGAKLERSGFGLDIGARAGAEIHFGFMGIPELSLQGGIGALFSMYSVKNTLTRPNLPEQSGETKHNEFTTTVNGNPWDIFTTNVAALYYF